MSTRQLTHQGAPSAPGCWFCDDAVRGEPPPGGWLVDDDTWRAGHAPSQMAAPGTVILETRRHVLDQAGFTRAEATTFVGVLGRLLTAIREALGCARVYQWSTMDAHDHFHVWLIPWWHTSAHRGPRHLADTVAGPGSQREALLAASRITQALDVSR